MKRPALRYHGGKWKLAPWIISHFPQHRVYVEPYGGGASVLLRKQRCYAEIYNDLDGEIVNMFRVYRDHGDELLSRLAATPFARDEFTRSYTQTEDEVEQARRTIVRSFMGFGSAAACGKNTGFRNNSNRSGTTPAHDWANFPRSAKALVERLQGVVIENKPAVELMPVFDSKDTLYYVDPPYVASTRDKGHDYRFEMCEDEHRGLASVLASLQGMVVVSGYGNDLYNEIFDGWVCRTVKAHADGALPRIECLWMNKACVDASQPLLMEVTA